MHSATHGQTNQLHRDGWRAELALDLRRVAGQTRLVRNRHRGPLMVQRPFYPEPDGTCHVYVLHPPGGMVQGDCLDIEITTRDDARALITSPAAAKCYRTQLGSAKQKVSLYIGARTCLEWLPQETIVFDRAEAETVTRVNLHEGSMFLGWELYCLGRPAADECFTEGKLTARLEVYRDGQPLWIDRSKVVGTDDALRNARWGFAGFPATGLFIATAGEECAALVSAIRDASDDNAGGQFTVTGVDGLIICRFLGNDISRARDVFMRIWALARNALIGKSIEAPRVWAT